MAVQIEVYRGAGDRPGGEIHEELLGESLPAALARGLAELDANATPWERVELEMAYRPDLAMGAIVSVIDPVQGESWRGKITALSHSSDGLEVITRASVRRPIP